MIFKLVKKKRKNKILYHAISSYQLLEIIIHRRIFHKSDMAVLILPDFIIGKYPNYKDLANKNFFDEVYLFPYLNILHREEKSIINDVINSYYSTIPHSIHSFFKIYVAGAHFYFSLFLIYKKISFYFFEDAAGILSDWTRLYKILSKKFPIHAKIALKYGLYNGNNKYVSDIICLIAEQKLEIKKDVNYHDFCVEKELEKLNFIFRRKIIKFFIKRRINSNFDSILLTQNFSNLGIMEKEEQIELFKNLKERKFKDMKVIIKRHPDDDIDYKKIFKGSYLIEEIFPSELLPYVFWKKPKFIYTFDSTGCENLKNHFIIKKISREDYAK